MCHYKCCIRQELNDKIAITDSIQTVLVHTIKAQLLCYKMAVDREGRSCKRSCSEWQYIDPFVAVCQTFCIAAEHRYVSQQVVSKEDRLCPLQMRVTRNDGLHIIFGLLDQSFLQFMQQAN
ncbi:hypothetical protein D3C76_859500 [compost metagenome]